MLSIKCYLSILVLIYSFFSYSDDDIDLDSHQNNALSISISIYLYIYYKTVLGEVSSKLSLQHEDSLGRGKAGEIKPGEWGDTVKRGSNPVEREGSISIDR